MCAVCSECSLNLVAGQVFVGACSVGFFSNLYYQGTNVVGYIVFALVYMYIGTSFLHKLCNIIVHMCIFKSVRYNSERIIASY